jgi:hypothetical protein
VIVTDDFLRHLLARPEIVPMATSCSAEVTLHEGVLQAPRRTVSPDERAALPDRDAADNCALWLWFRVRLLAKQTLEAGYMASFEAAGADMPPVLLPQLTQTLLRRVLALQLTDGRDGNSILLAGAETRANSMAIGEQERFKLKPQNLLLNLPLSTLAPA